MDFLSTTVTLLCILSLCATAFLAWQANVSATDARDAANELRATQARVKSHDLSIDALYTTTKRLDGKIGNLQQRSKQPLVRGEPFEDVNAEELDPEFAAELALQRAPAAAPGSKRA